jgi:D-alanyl-lipoteichoic acid acyltransferase DltB (MBOAT superfamily)
MLFNSYAFLFLFLPITAVGYFLLARRVGIQAAAAWLALASLFFYGYWDYHYVPLLLASIACNFVVGGRINAAHGTSRGKRLLIVGVAVNLALLAYYKYADFFLSSVATIAGEHIKPLGIILPLGISFFTFTQIAYLADAYIGKAKEYNFTNYVLFVTYFPHLIAGPILHHREMMPQFASRETYILRASNMSVGFTIFIIGLAKKVLIADNLAPHANHLFSDPGQPSLFLAWGGVLAYTFQLYFDFSGYSDMAIGLSRMFGVQLPLNFNSPYKAWNISEFWRRWHMTLSRFLRDYLYIPLGGNQKGRTRRYMNLMTTMLLGGLWHGAGWTFVAWGALHGAYLVVNHAWMAVRNRLPLPKGTMIGKVAATALTFLAVVVAWVFFRALSFDEALVILKGMSGGFGVALPQGVASALGPLGSELLRLGVGTFLGGGQRFVETYLWVIAAASLAFLAPNTQEIASRFEPALDFDGDSTSRSVAPLVWQPNTRWAVAIGVLGALCLLSLSRPTEFLYFQF